MALVLQTRWLDADAYASVVVSEEIDQQPEIPLEHSRHRSLQLLARASRSRRRRLSLLR